MKRVNIKESLLEIDRATDCRYDLTSLYEACKLDDEDKKKMVQYIEAHEEPEVMGSFLATKCEGLHEELADDDIVDIDNFLKELNDGEGHSIYALQAKESKELNEDTGWRTNPTNGKEVSRYVYRKISPFDSLTGDNSRYWDFDRGIAEGDDAVLVTDKSKMPRSAKYIFSLMEDGVDIDIYLDRMSDNDTWYVLDNNPELEESAVAGVAMALGTAAATGFGQGLGDKVGSKLMGEDADDEDLEYVSDFSDSEVEAGQPFFAEGYDWKWIRRIGDVQHLDFDNWAVWMAFRPEDENNPSEPNVVAFFIVDEDTGFIDWGPVDTMKEAQEFLQSKVDDYNMDEDCSQLSTEMNELYDYDDNRKDGVEDTLALDVATFAEDFEYNGGPIFDSDYTRARYVSSGDVSLQLRMDSAFQGFSDEQKARMEEELNAFLDALAKNGYKVKGSPKVNDRFFLISNGWGNVYRYVTIRIENDGSRESKSITEDTVLNPYSEKFKELGFKNASADRAYVYSGYNWIAKVNPDGSISAFQRQIGDTTYLGCPAHGSVRFSVNYPSWEEFSNAIQRTKKGAYVFKDNRLSDSSNDSKSITEEADVEFNDRYFPRIDITDKSRYDYVQHKGKDFAYDKQNNVLIYLFQDEEELEEMGDSAPWRELDGVGLRAENWNDEEARLSYLDDYCSDLDTESSYLAQDFIQNELPYYQKQGLVDEAVEPVGKVYNKDGKEIEPPLGRCKHCGKPLIAGESEEPHCSSCDRQTYDDDYYMLENSDEEKPYTKEQIESDLKQLTNNFTVESDRLKCGFKEEAEYSEEILSQYYASVGIDKVGSWFQVEFKDRLKKDNKVTEALDNNPIIDWLSEHEQAWEDFTAHFVGKDIESLSDDEIIGWISEHDTLYNDFKNRFPELSEAVNPAELTDCPECGDTSFDSKKGKCTKCNYREALEESIATHIYLFPELTDEDIDMLKAYSLKFLGKNHGADGSEDNWVVAGTEPCLNRYANNWLGYELHPDYLYDADDFASDIEEE